MRRWIAALVMAAAAAAVMPFWRGLALPSDQAMIALPA